LGGGSKDLISLQTFLCWQSANFYFLPKQLFEEAVKGSLTVNFVQHKEEGNAISDLFRKQTKIAAQTITWSWPCDKQSSLCKGMTSSCIVI
jgi:hypothetical protein